MVKLNGGYIRRTDTTVPQVEEKDGTKHFPKIWFRVKFNSCIPSDHPMLAEVKHF